jgi:predicted RNA methylase
MFFIQKYINHYRTDRMFLSGAKVLILSRGRAGALALMAVAHGAGDVVCVESCQLAYHFTKLLLESNKHFLGLECIKVSICADDSMELCV